MVRSAYKTIFPCLIEVFVEINVKYAFSFCSLDNDKSNRLPVNACFSYSLPANISLVVADIYTVNAETFGDKCISVKCFPPATYRCGNDHESVEEKDVKENYDGNSGPENTFCTTSKEQETKARTVQTRVFWMFPPDGADFACIVFMCSFHGLRFRKGWCKHRRFLAMAKYK